MTDGRRRSVRRIAAVLALVVLMPAGAAAQQMPSDQPVLLLADEVIHNRELDLVTARGHVEISQEGRVLQADTVNYNLRLDVMTASGNVSLLEPTGEVLFANYVELSGDLKEGLARDIRMLLANDARMAAVSGTRTGGDKTSLNHALYSACRPCQDDPDRPLLWQVKALRVVHDQSAKDVEYHDAWLEMFGVPVAYTPYFSHPDPSVERRSGFLPATVGSSSDLGALIQVPYLFVISPQQDFTFAPIFTTSEGVVLTGEHRRLFANGETITRASLTQDSSQSLLGHIEATGRFDLTDRWRAGYEIERSSTDTYLRRYRFSKDSERPWLVTRPYAERFEANSYLLAEAYSFQGLRIDDDPGLTPLVLPSLRYSQVGERGRLGGYWTLDASALAISRGEGTDTRRLSMEGGWYRPFLAEAGHTYTLGLSLRGDGYHVANRFGTGEEDVAGRLVPRATLEWRYPFTRSHANAQEVLEPIVTAVLSPYGGNPDEIPNEDSLALTFDDTNLFEYDRFSGLDRVESGPRVNYGLQWGIFGANGMRASVLAGQTYRLREDSAFPVDSGLRDNLSDYAGRVTVSWRDQLDLYYRFRLDKNTLAQRRAELSAVAGPPIFRARADYTFIDRISPTDEFGDREEAFLALSSAFATNWSASVYARYDIRDRDLLRSGVSLAYDDECFTMVASVVNDETGDRDYQGGTSLLLRLVFKTLGEVPISLF